MAMGVLSSKRGRNSRRAPMAEINVTPLVDVMLVLLIIFMVTAPLLTAGVPVDLPESRADALAQEQDQIDVSIDSEGFIYLDDALLDIGGFPEAISQVGCERAQPPLITLRADRSLDYGRVVAVMGELNRAGCRQISLVTNSSVSPP